MKLYKDGTQIHKVFHISGMNMEFGRERSERIWVELGLAREYDQDILYE